MYTNSVDSKEKEFEWDDESIENFDDTISDQTENKITLNDIPIKDEPDFNDHLNNQIKDLNLSSIELEIAEQIIGNIDDDGYLTTETILISDRLGINESIVLNTLKKIQKLDPIGIGSGSFGIESSFILFPTSSLKFILCLWVSDCFFILI